MKKNPKLSIIIPTYNEERDISNCIFSLLEQSYKNFEIIVVDDGSTDNTIKRIALFKNRKIKVLKQNHKGPGEARNLGARNSKGEILIFIDADMTFEKNYLKNLIIPIIEGEKVIGTSHDYEIATNTDNIWSKCWGELRLTGEYAKEPKIFRAIRRENFLKLGGFDGKYGYADDQTFWFKYKIKPVFAKETKCFHKNPEKLKEVFRQSRWIGASINNKFFKIPAIKYFAPLFLLLASPIAIPVISVRKSHNIKNFRIFFPWMIIFITFRYFGTMQGVFNKIYFNKNIR
jgi:glycosyltransferase involved in cell wall biosynthesis